ncbi:MAG: dihydrofolate reductase [bacterium]
MISLIAAIGKNNELGKNNDLIWKIPNDQKYFREKTSLHTVVMGRKTFESLGKPLPNRRNIVITRDANYKQKDVEIAHSLAGALDLVKDKNEEIFIIGGAEIYNQAIEISDKLYITHIDATDEEGDAFFPEIIPVVWNETSHKEYKKDDKNPFAYTFSIYERFF